MRAASIATAAMLLTCGSLLLAAHAAHIRPFGLAQAVIFPLALARTRRRTTPARRGLVFLELPLVAMALAQVDWLFFHHPSLGGALFVALAGLAIWIRRFGPRAAETGTLATLSLISTLFVRPDLSISNPQLVLGAAGVALAAAFWVSALQWLALPAAAGSRLIPLHPSSPGKRRTPSRGPALPSTRMALQMAVALSLALAAGRTFFPAHWTWVLLSAFIVCSGARNRGDVVHKGVLRTLGAAAGTLLAALAAGLSLAHPTASILLMFGVLATATWLRSVSYVYWAAGVTAALSLLYGYLGRDAQGLLHLRLAAIALGALLGIGASWLVLPIRTTDVLRLRTAQAMGALRDLLGCRGSELPVLEARQTRFRHTLEALEQIAPALEAHRLVLQRWRPGPVPADALDALRSCIQPIDVLIQQARLGQGFLGEPGSRLAAAALVANLITLQRAIGHQPHRHFHPLPPPSGAQGSEFAALTELDGAFHRVGQAFGIPVQDPEKAFQPSPSPCEHGELPQS